jgi:hypothetical protein
MFSTFVMESGKTFHIFYSFRAAITPYFPAHLLEKQPIFPAIVQFRA